jgi:hypothetical protein
VDITILASFDAARAGKFQAPGVRKYLQKIIEIGNGAQVPSASYYGLSSYGEIILSNTFTGTL